MAYYMSLDAVWSRLARKKRIGIATSDGQLDRCLSLVDLTSLGVGATLGVGIYVLAGSVAKDVAGPSVVLSFLFAGLASSLSGLCYAELGARLPKAGSAYVYSYATVGEGLGYVIGWNLVLEYAIGTASVARAYSGYIDMLFNKTMAGSFRAVMPINVPYLSPYPDLCAFTITMLLALILSVGVKESTRFNNVFTGLNVAVVVFVTFVGLLKADTHNWALDKDDIPADSRFGSGGFFPYGISGTLAGSATCFYGFVGFDAVATSGEEAVNPRRNIPLAIVLSMGFVLAAYVGISSTLTLMLPYYLQDGAAPLPYAFHRVGWPVPGRIVSVGALFGLSTSLMGAMFPLPRIIYAMSTDGLLFRWLAYVHPRYQTPFRATIVAGVLTGTVAALFDLKSLVDMMSIGTLMAYTVVALVVVRLRYQADACSDSAEYMVLTSSSRESCSDDGLCSDNDRAASSSAGHDTWKLIVCPWAGDRRASPASSQVANLLTFAAFLANVCLASVLVTGGPAALAAFFCLFVAGLTLWTSFLPTAAYRGPDSSFRVPLVPFLPNASIFLNVYLMMKLSMATWIRLAVWMAVGMAIYATYGWSHSSEEKEARK